MVRRVAIQDDWPDSWKYSYPFDLQEIYGEVTRPGYVYAYRNRQRATFDLISEALNPGATILDMGAAQGNFSLALAELGYRVTWNDLRAELADYVRLKYERGDIRYAPGNAFELSFSEPFDAVLITEIIEHVAHPDAFLQNAAKLVRPGGYIVMTTPNGGYFRNRLPRFSDCADPSMYEAQQFQPDDEGHIFLLWPDEIQTLAARSGLQLQTLRLLTTPLTNGHVKTSGLLRILPEAVVNGLEAAAQRLLPWAAKTKLMVMAAARLQRDE